MWEELFRDGTSSEILKIALLVGFMGFGLLIPFAWIFAKTLALNERPDRRALWTTAAAYTGGTLVWTLGSGDFIPAWAGPLVPLPGALVIYFWLRSIYREGWVDDDKVPEGMVLANSDWRVGIGVVVAVAVAAAVKVAFVT